MPEPRALLLALLLAGCSSPPPPPLAPLESARAEPGAAPAAEPRSRRGNPPSYVALGRRYHVLASAEGYVERGLASWYGPNFHGEPTSSGERFDMHRLSAAHKTLPLPAWVEVTHLENGRRITVRVNDRGPFKPGRIIDLSYAAAQALGIAEQGVAPVEVRAIRGPAAAAAAERVYLQLGAFRSRRYAEDFRRRLAARGVADLSLRAARGGLVRVMHGPLDGTHAIERAADALAAAGVREYTVVGLPR